MRIRCQIYRVRVDDNRISGKKKLRNQDYLDTSEQGLLGPAQFLRLRLHGRGFLSKRFHDLETASKTTIREPANFAPDHF